MTHSDRIAAEKGRDEMTTWDQAVRYTMGVLFRAKDWQEGQHALADHDTFGPWLEETGDPLGEAQAIIAEAEARLGDDLPY